MSQVIQFPLVRVLRRYVLDAIKRGSYARYLSVYVIHLPKVIARIHMDGKCEIHTASRHETRHYPEFLEALLEQEK